LEYTLIDHCERSASITKRVLLGGLENELYRSTELVFHGCEYFCDTDSDRGMDIVAACVHRAIGLGPIGDSALLLNREGIHIASNPENLPLPETSREKSHDTCFRHAPLYPDAKVTNMFLDYLRCPDFLESNLRMRMKVTSSGDEIIQHLICSFHYVLETPRHILMGTLFHTLNPES
jgi:hypothetical protein